MTGQQPGPRIVPPGEARKIAERFALYQAPPLGEMVPDLAHTAAVLGEQRDAVLALHEGLTYESPAGLTICETCDEVYPCPTARALGVES